LVGSGGGASSPLVLPGESCVVDPRLDDRGASECEPRLSADAEAALICDWAAAVEVKRGMILMATCAGGSEVQLCSGRTGAPSRPSSC
jgi:hypothetical protein